MAIQTIHNVGADAVQLRFGLVYRHAMRALGLAKFGIKISLGVLHLLNENPLARPLFTKLFFHKGIESAGKNLDNDGLCKILRECAFRSPEIKSILDRECVPDFAPWHEISAALKLDFDLRVIFEDDFAIIATSEEELACAGEKVAEATTALAVRSGGVVGLALRAGGADIAAALQTRVNKAVDQLVDLAIIRDGAKFLEAMYAVSPFMRGEDNDRDLFIGTVAKRFYDFGPEVRKEIAKELIKFGLDERLMDDIAVFSSDQSEVQRAEAINGIAAKLKIADRDPFETLLGLLAIFKFIEETSERPGESTSNLVFHAARKLVELLPLLLSSYGEVKSTKAINVLRKLLVSDPAKYGPIVGFIFVAIGKQEPAEISRLVREELGATGNIALTIIFYWVLQQVEAEKDGKEAVFRERLRIYLGIGNTPQASILAGQFKARPDESLAGIIREFDSHSTTGQQRLIALIDQIYPKLNAGSKAAASHFITGHAIGDKRELKLAAIKTAMIYDPSMSEFADVFADGIVAEFGELSKDRQFLKRLAIENPEAFLVPLAGRVGGIEDPSARLSLLGLLTEKASHVAASTQELQETATSLARSAVRELRDRSDTVRVSQAFDLVGRLAAVPILDQGGVSLIFDFLSQPSKPIDERTALPAMARLAERPNSLPSNIPSQLSRTFQKWMDLLLPKPPGAAAAASSVDEVVSAQGNLKLLDRVLNGVAALFENNHLDAEAQKKLAQLLVDRARVRKQIVVKSNEPKPDPAKEMLLSTLDKISKAQNTDGPLKRALVSLLPGLRQ